MDLAFLKVFEVNDLLDLIEACITEYNETLSGGFNMPVPKSISEMDVVLDAEGNEQLRIRYHDDIYYGVTFVATDFSFRAYENNSRLPINLDEPFLKFMAKKFGLSYTRILYEQRVAAAKQELDRLGEYAYGTRS